MNQSLVEASQRPVRTPPVESTRKKLFTFVPYYFHGLLSCVYLFGFGFLWGRHRKSIYKIASELGNLPANPDKPAATLPKIQPSDILPAPEDLKVLEPMALDGNVTLLELVIINQLLRQQRARICFEIGTFDGRTALNLAANCVEAGRVYTLDLPQEDLGTTKLPLDASDIHYVTKPASGQRFRGTRYEAKITQLYGDSANFDYSPYRGRMDCVFVDGSHSYEYVLNDSFHALELLQQKGGIILWHDYDSWPGVTYCLNMLYSEKPEFRGLRHIQGTSLACLLNCPQ